MSSEQAVQRQAASGEIQKQVLLPFSKAWQICIKGIKIRLQRSLITAAGIFLGIAFFSSVRAGSLWPPAGNDAEAIAAANRQQWLAVMALLVCFVGITNSMLMSVTERFKEIGTMKCLGALDSFIVKLFFIEAALMGVSASILGWFAGWFIIVLVRLFTDGMKAFTGEFWSGTAIQMAQSIVIGSLITLIAAIPPAARAAAMPPVAALRSEI